MPELPEVETTLRGLRPHLEGRAITGLRVRNGALRWPVAPDLASRIGGRRVSALSRRGKYLLLHLPPGGTLLLHLGMSGSLRVVPAELPPRKHDHVDLLLDSARALRFHDPRRFGCILWQPGNPNSHPLLARLGPEPLGSEFDGDYLRRRSRGRRGAVKNLIMDSHIVVGVGNIYACESLFAAGIHPARPAGRISAQRYHRLATAIRAVLQAAIEAGGTTLRDFTGAEGRPGYFARQLAVYGRAGEACSRCGSAIRLIRLGQRATYYCPRCQR